MFYFIFRYSNAVEKAIEEVLSEAQSDEDRSIIKDFLNLSVLSVQHHMIADSDASLTLSLNHRLPMVRQSAVKHLLEFADTVSFDTGIVVEVFIAFVMFT